MATWHVRSKDRARKQLLSYYNYLRLAADLCLLFELVAILWGKRLQNLLVAYFSIEREPLLEQWLDHVLVALGNKERACQLRQRGSDPPLVSQLPKKRQALLEPGGSPSVFALLIVEQSMHEERPGDTIPVTHLSEESEVFLQQDAC